MTLETGTDPDLASDQALLEAGGSGVWALSGDLTVRSLPKLLPHLSEIGAGALDLSRLRRMDTSGAYALLRLGDGIALEHVQPDHAALLDRVESAMPKPDASDTPKPRLIDRFDALGRKIVGALSGIGDVLAMLGIFLAKLGTAIRHPAQFRMTALVHHCDQVGWKAVPIVALMGFLIGIVLAFQGSVQLRQFGAEIFVVDLIAISMLRELGILLTAIIVAGRTASSYTAAIGSMKMREEIDAMRTLAIDPALALFVPRILALLIVLPILGMIANLTGLIGGALMAWIELGISPGVFLARLLDDTSIDHVIVGFVKAPVFALIIGVIGCHAGMQVGGNAESLGTQTSSAVVRAIFMVIVAGALFSVFFAILGI